MKNNLGMISVCLALVALTTIQLEAATLYVVSHSGAKVWAFTVNGTQLDFAAERSFTAYGYGPTDLAVDETTDTLFICNETSNRINLVDSK